MITTSAHVLAIPARPAPVRTLDEWLPARRGWWQRARKVLRRLGRRAPATAPNRRLLLELLDQRLSEGKRWVGVVTVDFDRLAAVNAGYGRDFGDAVVEVARRRLMASVRSDDAVARVAGGFAVVLCDVVEPSDVEQVARRLHEHVSSPMQVAGRHLVVTASVGTAAGACGDGDAATLMRNAEAAVSVAKSQGRDRVVAFEPFMEADAVAKMEMASALRTAAANGELSVLYQPIVHMASGRIHTVEALLRWRRADGTDVPPADFIPLAEELGLIHDLGRWVLEASVAQVRRWTDELGEAPAVSVNVSALQFERAGFPGEVLAVLEEAGVDPSLLVLELTESLAVTERHEAALHELREQGVRVAVDDFGTGYSSLRYLAKLPVDELKIDRAFVAGIDRGEIDSAVVRAMLNLAQTFGYVVVAEGVERPEQFEELAELGCDYVQGFAVARPAAACDVTPLLGALTLGTNGAGATARSKG